MTCEQCAALLADHLDGALSTGQRAAVEEHVAACPRCAKVVSECRALPELLRQATNVPMPPEAKARLREFLARKTR